MDQPVLTETDFLVRTFPAPGNPYRPLAVVAPTPGEGLEGINENVRNAARNGYGGIVLDPAVFGRDFLTEAWFKAVSLYLEACRLAGLLVWLLDGFMAGGDALASILDGIVPDWRGEVVMARAIEVRGPERLEMRPITPSSGRLLGMVARAMDSLRPPINLLPCLYEDRVIWDAPPGAWEVTVFYAAGSEELPATASFSWTDARTVAAWLHAAFDPYTEFLGPHLGRTLQGFFISCPTLAFPLPDRGTVVACPLPVGDEPEWSDLAAFAGAENVPRSGRSYLARLTETVARTYLAPLRDWCWRHRLRIAGYRLGGAPLAGILSCFDLGGLPDLAPGADQDTLELAALGGLARYYGQERVACRWRLSGEMSADRAALGHLAVSGADLYLVKERPAFPLDCEATLMDYAARLATAAAAGGPAVPVTFDIGVGLRDLRETGRQILDLAHAGVEASCRPTALATSAGAVTPGPVQAAAAGHGARIPVDLGARMRKVEDWLVCTICNLAPDPWRGSIALPADGVVEIWRPATGERRPAHTITAGPDLCLPIALARGEATVVVARRPRPGQPPPERQALCAHLRLGWSWLFEARDGNLLPLDWRVHTPGHWQASFFVLSPPEDLRLVGRTYPSLTWLNGELLAANDASGQMAHLLIPGENLLEMRTVDQTPTACARGRFVLRGVAVIEAPHEIAGPWTQNGYPCFAGPGIYRQTFKLPMDLCRAGLAVRLEIEALAGAALVRLNGATAGSLPWPPFRLDLGSAPLLLRPGENTIEIEVHVPVSKPPWSLKGLLGEVSLVFTENTV